MCTPNWPSAVAFASNHMRYAYAECTKRMHDHFYICTTVRKATLRTVHSKLTVRETQDPDRGTSRKERHRTRAYIRERKLRLDCEETVAEFISAQTPRVHAAHLHNSHAVRCRRHACRQ